MRNNYIFKYVNFDNFISFLGIILGLFILYTARFGLFGSAVQRGVPLAIMLTIIFLTSPIVKGDKKYSPYWRLILKIINIVFIFGSIASIFYLIIFEGEIAFRVGAPTLHDTIMSLLGFLGVLEAARRIAPKSLFVVVLLSIAYAVLGDFIPGEFGHRGFPLPDLIQYLFLSNEGIFGLALRVMVNFIFVFLLFSNILSETGVGRTIIDFGLSLTGKLKGGAALSAVVASAMFGSISGSGSSNVLATGTFTIPLMKEAKFEKNYAGAVEAVASSGGMFTPPVMASAAFILAELVGIPYVQLCYAAAIPALLYYVAVFAMIFLRACKQDLDPIPKEKQLDMKKILSRGGIYFLPIILLVYLLIIGYTPPYAAFYSIVLSLLLSLVKKNTRKNLFGYLKILDNGVRQARTIFASMAVIGVIIGTVSLTGLGIKFSIMITKLTGENLFLALLLAMSATLVLSMGMPTLPAYLLVIVILGRGLETLGIPLLAAHLFVFYFASMSSITPPVCMSVFAAAGISGGDPMKIAIHALRLGIVGFIIPYVYAFNPALILIGSLPEILFSVFVTLLSIIFLAVSLEGFFLIRTPLLLRLLFFAGSLFLLLSNVNAVLLYYGLFILVAAIIISIYLYKNKLTNSII